MPTSQQTALHFLGGYTAAVHPLQCVSEWVRHCTIKFSAACVVLRARLPWVDVSQLTSIQAGQLTSDL